MKIAIFGSCVSRDTCQFIANSSVVAYVARHSVASLDTPHGDGDVDIKALDSPFQRRMVTRELKGRGAIEIVELASQIDLVLIDLVDERRGYWLYPDNTTMTNSIEIDSCGASQRARRAGARLVRFGTDEHFERWKSGFGHLTRELADYGLLDRTVLLDIEWAAAVDGAQPPQDDNWARVGRMLRRLQRGKRAAIRSLNRGENVVVALSNFRDVRPTETENYADRAAEANAAYVRYRMFAKSMISSSVTRMSDQVRINRNHKWGPQPFHYRDKDYQSIVQNLLELVENLDT